MLYLIALFDWYTLLYSVEKMGGSVSSGKDNDELIDNLIDAALITSKHVENVFRTVDRGNYYTSAADGTPHVNPYLVPYILFYSTK